MHVIKLRINWWEVGFMLWSFLGATALLVLWMACDAQQVRDWGWLAVVVWLVVLAVFSICSGRHYDLTAAERDALDVELWGR